MASKAPKLEKDLALINWNEISAVQVDRIHRSIGHRVIHDINDTLVPNHLLFWSKAISFTRFMRPNT